MVQTTHDLKEQSKTISAFVGCTHKLLLLLLPHSGSFLFKDFEGCPMCDSNTVAEFYPIKRCIQFTIRFCICTFSCILNQTMESDKLSLQKRVCVCFCSCFWCGVWVSSFSAFCFPFFQSLLEKFIIFIVRRTCMVFAILILSCCDCVSTNITSASQYSSSRSHSSSIKSNHSCVSKRAKNFNISIIENENGITKPISFE